MNTSIYNTITATPPDVVCPPGGWRKFEGRCYKLLTDYNQITLCRYAGARCVEDRIC